jgi:hypothetical protein
MNSSTSLAPVALIVGGLGALALVEVLVPLHVRDRRQRAHVVPNLALTAIAIAASALLNVAGSWRGLEDLGRGSSRAASLAT